MSGTGATAVGVRATAPDLARALMLALIALANVHLFLYGAPVGARGYPVPEGDVDTAVTAGQLLLVDARVYPLFALLLGYGLARVAERHDVPVLARRGIVLLLLGALHGVLLFSGDIVGAYGALTLLLAGVAATATSSGLLLAVVVTVVFGVLVGAPSSAVGGSPYQPSVAVPDALSALAMRAGEWPSVTISSAIIVVPAVLFGVLVARGGYLDRPAEHRRLLAAWALIGLPSGAALGLPFTLIAVGWWAPAGDPDPLVGMLHTAGGYLGALGWLGVLGLLASVRLPGRALLAAAGTWSLTLYVSQSAVFTGLLAAWAGGLGDGMSIGTGALVGLATWAVSVLVAGLLARRGHRGPLERVVRRVTYGR